MDFHYLGKLKSGVSFITESPIEEAWGTIRRHSTPEFLASYIYTGGNLPKDEVIKYCRARFRQTCEFRDAGRSSTLVTKPLPLYYSILNMTRAVIVLRKESRIEGGHGLHCFEANPDLLACSVRTQKTGTFPALWQMYSGIGDMPESFTLKDCLSQIPEALWTFNSPLRGASLCIPIDLELYSAGKPILIFNHGPIPAESFEQHWKSWFPKIAAKGGTFEMSAQGKIRVILPAELVVGQDGRVDPERVVAFSSEFLISDLSSVNTKRFYLLRAEADVPPLKRELAYFGAMHILSSVVRYEPEALLQTLESGSETAWFLEKFLQAVERYYPQLMLSLSEKRNIYYSYAQ